MATVSSFVISLLRLLPQLLQLLLLLLQPLVLLPFNDKLQRQVKDSQDDNVLN